MTKDIVIAKVRRWKAEMVEMIEALKQDGKSGPIVDLLDKRSREIDDFIDSLEDNSLISGGDVAFQPEPVMDEIAKKVQKIKTGVKKIRSLSNEKTRILEDLSNSN